MQDTDAKYGLLLGHLADNIRAARLKNNLRQSDMIEFGFSERFIQKLESGKYSPNLYTIHRLALALKVPISKLFKVSTNSEDR